MDVFQQLRQFALDQGESGDFPQWVLPHVLEIGESMEKYGQCRDLVKILMEQLQAYDPYAGAGCFGDAVGIDAIFRTIEDIRATGAAGPQEEEQWK